MNEQNEKYANDFASAIRQFESLIAGTTAASRHDLEQLSLMLSILLQFGEECPEAFSDSEPEPPAPSYEALTARLKKRFPKFGFYNTVTPSKEAVGCCSVSVGDAIDDIADIYLDLAGALWYFDNGDPALCLWQAKLLFFHWGRHAICLKSFLHEQLHETS